MGLDCGALLALPTLLVRSPPMTDLPMHEGIVGLLLHWGDDAFVPRGLYRPNFGHPNQLFHVVAYALAGTLGARVGFALAVAIAQAAIVGCGAHFARHLRAPWWSALWLSPLALGWVYFWGLAANLYGLALFLPAVLLVDRCVSAPTARNGAALGLVYALLFFAHETAMAAIALVHLLFLVLRRDRRAWQVGSAAIAFSVILAVVDRVSLATINTAAERVYVADVVFAPPWSSLAALPATVFGSHPLPVLLALVAIFSLSVLATHRAAASTAPSSGPVLDRLYARRFEAAGLAFLLAYFVVPEQLFGVTMLNARFAGYAWALLLPSLGAEKGFVPPSARPTRLATLVSMVAALALPFAALPAFLESQERNAALDRIAAKIEPGQATMVQRIHPRRPDDLFTAVSCGRLLAERGGRCQGDFTRTSISPVRMREDLLWSALDEGRNAGGPAVLRPKIDLRAYRYLGFCCATPDETAEYAGLLAPYARLIADDDGWIFFESKLPRIPPNAPDRLLFAPPPPPSGAPALP